MRHLREVNVDNNTVGWYTSTYLSSFLSESLIQDQFNYQTTISKCVVVVYDPLKVHSFLHFFHHPPLLGRYSSCLLARSLSLFSLFLLVWPDQPGRAVP